MTLRHCTRWILPSQLKSLPEYILDHGWRSLGHYEISKYCSLTFRNRALCPFTLINIVIIMQFTLSADVLGIRSSAVVEVGARAETLDLILILAAQQRIHACVSFPLGHILLIIISALIHIVGIVSISPAFHFNFYKIKLTITFKSKNTAIRSQNYQICSKNN